MNSDRDEMILAVASNMKILAAAMVEKAQSGHPGGAMGGATFMATLYSEFLRFHPDDGCWRLRDRFFLDAGHLSALLYTTLFFCGFFSLEDLKQFRQWKSVTPGHPEIDRMRGVENTSGPLGQGHAFAVGAAIAGKFLQARFGEPVDQTIYSYITDGGIQEEISQGAGRIAGHLGLDNLILFYDANQIQLATPVDVVTSEDTEAKYRCWGWRVLRANGSEPNSIRKALKEAVKEKKRPTLIIGETVMAEGAVGENGDSFEGRVATHGAPLSRAGASFEKTVERLGGDPQNPFEIFPDVGDFFQNVLEEKRKDAAARDAFFRQWGIKHPQKRKRFERFFEGGFPDIALEKITQPAGEATRSASGRVLKELAREVENMLVLSADLSPADKTEAFLKETTPLQKGDFSGAFLHAGVSELTMAALCSGMALHGGVQPVCGTFLAFSDYMKPILRTAALMELPVIYVWTHDSFAVGEDGPTHQPVEHEAQLRLMEQLYNHSGDPSVLVLRPADGNETNMAWKLALKNRRSPSAILLSRQAVGEIPPLEGSTRVKDASEVEKGAALVYSSGSQPDLILVANGSEVAMAVGAAELLAREEGRAVNVVSVLSEGLFRRQSSSYQETILPTGVQKVGITAGLPVTLRGLVGSDAPIWGMKSFGFSAPFSILAENLGFTPEKLFRWIKEFLEGV